MMPACSRCSRWRWAATRAGDRDANRSTSSCQTEASIGTPKDHASQRVVYDFRSAWRKQQSARRRRDARTSSCDARSHVVSELPIGGSTDVMLSV
jgi:hypothetical protein